MKTNDSGSYNEISSQSLNRVTAFVLTPVWVVSKSDIGLIREDFTDYQDFVEMIERRVAA